MARFSALKASSIGSRDSSLARSRKESCQTLIPNSSISKVLKLKRQSLQVGGQGPNPAYRVYCFKEDRRHNSVLEILQGYRGIIHLDKYGAYQKLAAQKVITWMPCFAHICSKFFESEGTDPPFRAWVLRKIRYLFLRERVAWARSPEERLRIRKEKEAPIID